MANEENVQHKALLPVDLEFLEDMLHLPEGVKITGAHLRSFNGYVVFELEHPDFPATPLLPRAGIAVEEFQHRVKATLTVGKTELIREDIG